MEPATQVHVAAATILALTSTLSLGELVRRALRVEVESLLALVTLDCSLGSLALMLVSLALSIPRAFTSEAVTAVTLASLCSALYLSRRELRELVTRIVASFKSRLTILMVVVIFLSWLLRFAPAVGLYAPPGDDPKMHATLVKLIVDNRGVVGNWGELTPWTTSSRIAYPLGFHCIVAYIQLLSWGFLNPATAVLLVTQFYNFMIVLAIYTLALMLFERRSVALAAASMMGLASQSPLLFFWWGGNAQLAADFMFLSIIPLLAFNLVGSGGVKGASWLRGVAASLLLGGAVGLISYVNVLSTASIIIAVVILVATRLLKYRHNVKWRFIAAFAAAFIAVFVICNIPSFMSISDPDKMQFTDYFCTLWWSYDITLSVDQLLSPSCLSYVYNALMAILNYSGLIVVMGLIGFSLGLSNEKDKLTTLVLALWVVVLLLLNMNGPNGPYFIKFPGWYVFVPGRMLHYCSYAFTVMSGYATAELYRALSSRSDRGGEAFLAIMCVLIAICLVNNSNFLYATREDSPVLSADIEAFAWIQANTDRESLFLVSDCDAGQWIPVFTGRPVVPMFVNFQSEPMVNMSYWREMCVMQKLHVGEIHEALIKGNLKPEVIDLLRHYGVDYIYVGSKSIYDRMCFNVTALKSSDYFKLVYSRDGVSIFEVVRA